LAASKGLFLFSLATFFGCFVAMLEINGFLAKKAKKRLKFVQLFFEKLWKF
jgi:hypothetical protein